MDFNTLRYNLQLPYQRNNWKEWLLQLFGQQISIETLAEKIIVQKGNAKSIERFASITLSDDKNIAVLDIKTNADIQIARNRVALRDIAFNLIDQDKYHGLLVFYHSEDDTQLDYRLSFISRQTTIDEDGNFIQQSTNAKRYSFILGVNESCTTATLRLLELKSKVPSFKAFEIQKGISLKDLTDTFSVEALNNEFFKKYKDIHYKRFWEYIANKPEYATLLLNTEETELTKQQKPIRDFVKKMLGRIVFLHFLQKKGWMGVPFVNDKLLMGNERSNWNGGDKHFMQNLFARFPQQENFYSQCLTVLFFQTLNTDRRKQNDIAPKQLTINHLQLTIKIPFLNGGLFDDELPQTNAFDFPIDYFKDLFDFFSQYNFTIDENSPEEQEVGIDPEMLGHIFENLLEENKDKGAFYTPKEIVHYMCQESLIQYLLTQLLMVNDKLLMTEQEREQLTTNHLPLTIISAIETFIRKDDIGSRTDKKNFIVANAKRIEAILDKVKICDPAIGSGAFPMGMLQEIFKAKTTLDLTLDKAQVKKDIIRNNIYGVDLEKGAVDIARLRFWLSLVVDEEEPQPLPNLDYKIMQGNSLLESFEEIDLSNLLDYETDEPIIYAEKEQIKLFEEEQQSLLIFDKVTKDELQALISLYFDFEEHTNVTKFKTKQAVKQAINKIIEGKLKAHFYLQKIKIESVKDEVELSITANAIKPTDSKGVADKKTKNLILLTKKLKAFDDKINHLTELLNKLNKWETEDKERPYFLWHTYFKDVFDKGGFDIVIGNPPYLDYRLIDKSVTHNEKFKNTNSNSQRPNLYLYFIDHSDQIIRSNGILTFINPNQFLSTDSGLGIRKHLVDERTLISFDDVSYVDVFKEAATYTTVFFYKKIKSSKGALIKINRCKDLAKLGEASFYLFQNDIKNDSKKMISISGENSIIKKIEGFGFATLKEISKMLWGTSATGYGKKKIKLENYNNLKSEVKSKYEPIIQTADIKSHYILWKQEYIPKDIFSKNVTLEFIKEKIVIGRLTKKITTNRLIF